MNQKDIKYIYKLANRYEKQACQLEKLALAPLAAIGYIFTAGLVGNLVGGLAKYLQSSSEVIDNIKKLYDTLIDYKKSYTFGKHDALLSEYTDKCKSFIDSYNKIGKTADDKDPAILEDFKTIVTSGEFIQERSQAVTEAIEDMKSFAGSAFEAVRFIGLNFGLETDTTTIIDYVAIVNKMLSALLPEFKLKRDKLLQKINEHTTNQVSSSPSTATESEQTTTDPSKPTDKDESILDQFANFSF